MRRLSGDDEVFDRLIREGDAIPFNLLYLIREYPDTLLGERLKCNPALKVNAQERFAGDVLRQDALAPAEIYL